MALARRSLTRVCRVFEMKIAARLAFVPAKRPAPRVPAYSTVRDVSPLIKRCPDCGKTQRLDAFGIDRSKPDAHHRICRRCVSKNAGHVHRGPSKTTATHKWCPRCRRSKLHSAFYNNRGQRRGLPLSQFCKPCTLQHTRAWRAKQRAIPRKKCAACRRLLPTAKFLRSTISDDGFFPSCVSCVEHSRREGEYQQHKWGG